MSAKEVRVLWIDYVRDIGIWTVVLGHSFCSEDLKQYIYSFHMPLFFLLSGIFLRDEKYIDFVSHKFKTLIIPYLVFNLFFYCLNLLGVIYLFSNDIIWYKPLVSMVFGYGSLCCHASWFIVCLFMIENIYYGLKKYVPGYFVVVVLLGFLGAYCIPPIKFWNLSIALVGIVFYGIGKIGKKYIYSLADFKTHWLSMLGVGTLLISFYPIYINGKVDMVFNIYGDYYYLFILNALFGIISMLCLGILLNRLLGNAGASIITYVSKNLILILLLHPFANSFIYKFWVRGDDLSNIITSFLSILLLIPVIYFVNCVCPWIIGRKVSVYKMKSK